MVQNLRRELSRSGAAREQTTRAYYPLELPTENAWPPAAPQRGAHLPRFLKFLPLFPVKLGAILTQHTFLVTDKSWWGTARGVCNANLSDFYSTVEQPKSLTAHTKTFRQMHVHKHRLAFNQLWKRALKFRSVQHLRSQQMPQVGLKTRNRDL